METKTNKHDSSKLVAIGVLLLCAGCSSAVPAELSDARKAYARASQGVAAKQAPADLHVAKVSLDRAEESFEDDSDSDRTRTLAYVAERKAELAEVIGAQKLAESRKQEANVAYRQKEGQMAQDTKVALAKSQTDLAASKLREKDVAAALAKLAATKEEARGLVITLSGSVLFASDQSVLLPAAQARLDQVAAALMATKDRNLTVEGHTDSQGSADHNMTLSQARADAVRTYIISRGYPTGLIQSHGIGKDRPVASNANAEGRANNRRVEIIINPVTASL